MPRSSKSESHDSGNSSSSRSWWSMLARARKSGKKVRDREGNEEQASIKERVLAKLAEPLSSELKHGGRHSVDAPSYREREAAAETEDAIEQLCSTPCRHSTSSSPYWSSSSLAVEPSAPRGVHHASCGSPTSTSNVIARLMGLGDLSPAYIPQHHVKKEQLPVPDRKKLSSSAAIREDIIRVHQYQQPRRPYAQDFLDEMEDHLRQCDQALERIEAVMQLKKKLLCLNTSARTDVYNTAHVQSKNCHARSRSMDHATTTRARRCNAHQFDQPQEKQEIPTAPQSLFQHRRSVSDGATPVFCPYDIEVDIMNSRNLMQQSRNPSQISTPPRKTKANFRIQEEIREMLEKQRRCFGPANGDSEQPSPVSVLDNINNDSSEDDRAPDCQRPRGDESNSNSGRKKSSVARALWADEPTPAAARVVGTQGGGGTTTGGDGMEEDVVRAIDRRWSQGIGAEAKEVAARVECIILRRLIEETIVAVALGCARHRGRTRGDP